MRRIGIGFLFILVFSLANAQEKKYIGPLINLNKSSDLLNKFKLKSNIELRQRMFEESGSDFKPKLSQQRASFQTIIQSENINSLNYGLGGMYRINNQGFNQYRLIQQMSYLNKINHLNFGHRFRMDQTWQKNEELTIRVRYRLTSQISLQGQKLDPGEFYLKLNTEYLGIFEADYSTELRFVALVGKKLKSETKYEFGLDYRRNIAPIPIKTAWLSLQIYLN